MKKGRFLFCVLIITSLLSCGTDLNLKKRSLVELLALDALFYDANHPSAPSYFAIAVGTQNPPRMRNGRYNPENYRDIGINTYAALWEWPYEENMGIGYNEAAARILQENGMKAYAGRDQAAVQWLANNPEYADTFIGYFLGDEPDMRKVATAYEDYADIQPDQWRMNGTALRRSDRGRGLVACFGKGFAMDPWVGYHPTTTKEEDFEKYVDPLTVVMADYFGLTDPYEVPEEHGIWTYGRAVSNVKKYAGDRTVWGILEGSCPWTREQLDNSVANRMYERMQAHLVKPVVWNMIVHGAQGIMYFCHDFSRGEDQNGNIIPNGFIEDGPLIEPGMPEAMRRVHDSIYRYEPVLLSPDGAGTTQVNDGAVPVTLLTKIYGGSKYIFAMGDGNSTYRDGQTVNATITVAGAPAGTVTVNVENVDDETVGTIQMVDGRITDHFGPYELHIYVIRQQ